jgi:hypothetical protein
MKDNPRNNAMMRKRGKAFGVRHVRTIMIVASLSLGAAAQTFDSIPSLQAVTWPSGVNRPLFVPIWASLYSLSGNSTNPGSSTVEVSLYEPYNGKTDGWWDNLFEEFMYAGINNSIILTRATVNPNGDWNNLAARMIPALKRAGIYEVQKFGQFEDCGAWASCFKSITGGTTVDWADTTTMIKIMWDYCVKRFHDYLPIELWLRYNGKPLWVGWGSGGTNMNGNVSKVLHAVKTRFKAAYNEDLFIVVDQAWKKGDPTITGVESDAYQSWFGGGNSNTVTNWNGYKVEVLVPGFNVPGHGADFNRDHGNRYRDALNIGTAQSVDIQVEEGYVDMREGCGIYRSPIWDYPSQYLEILREYLDQSTLTRRFQAEACDSFYNKTSSNTIVVFSARKLDVSALPAPNYGWYVGGTDVGDWLLWKAPFFTSGTYDVYIHYASATAGNLTLSIGGKTEDVSLPSTSGAFQGKKIVAGRTLSGNNDIKMTLQTAGMQVDFLHFNRTDGVSIMHGAEAPAERFTGTRMAFLNGNRIDYTVPFENSVVDMHVFTSTGRVVWQYHAVQSGKGLHSVDWAAANNAPGAYIVKMSVKNNTGVESAQSSNRCIIFPR